MDYAAPMEPTALSRWTSRLAVFALLLLLTAFVLHRLFAMPTPVALNLVLMGYATALAAIAFGVTAAVRIWRRGGAGTARVIGGSLLSLFLFAIPLSLVVLARDYPPLNDVTTDTSTPPEFNALAIARGPWANATAYKADKFARVQTRAFPDIRPAKLTRSANEVFDLAVEVVKRQRMEIVRADPPADGAGARGVIEAVDRTLVAGFYDDVVIRITGGETASRLDIRSMSRYGRYDFGRNAERVRTLMREIETRVASTVPAVQEEDEGAGKDGKKRVKPDRDGDPKKANRRKKRARD